MVHEIVNKSVSSRHGYERIEIVYSWVLFESEAQGRALCNCLPPSQNRDSHSSIDLERGGQLGHSGRDIEWLWISLGGEDLHSRRSGGKYYHPESVIRLFDAD